MTADDRSNQIHNSDGPAVRQEDTARSHGESLQQGPDTSSNPSTAATPHGKGSDAASVANPVATSGIRDLHAAADLSEAKWHKGFQSRIDEFRRPSPDERGEGR